MIIILTIYDLIDTVIHRVTENLESDGRYFKNLAEKEEEEREWKQNTVLCNWWKCRLKK